MTQPRVFSGTLLFRIWLTACLLACGNAGFAQYSPSFDSAYRAAEMVPDAQLRLARLRPLIESAYGSTPFQTISFGKVLLRTATEVGSDSDLYQAHLMLCTGYERNRDYEQAVAHGLKAVDIARQRNDALRETRTLQTLAFTYGSFSLMSGNPEDKAQAVRYANEAMNVVSKKGVRQEAGYALTVAADVYAMFGQYDTAIVLYGRAIAAHRLQGQKVPMAAYMNLGNTLYYKKDYSGSLAAYRAADTVNAAQGNSDFYRVKIASNRSILYDELGQPGESRTSALQVLADARRMGATDVETDMLGHLRKLYEKEGRYKEALAFADSLAAVKERMLSAEKDGQIAEMQARYDAGVKDQQIAGQQETILRNRQQNMLLWCGIALLVAAGAAAVAGLTRSRRLNRELSGHRQTLVTQKGELQQVNDMKDRLFGLISHDVRVPLNALSAYATLLDQQGDLPPEKIRQYNADLRQTLGDTTVLMENLLQFARTQMQTPRPYPAVFELGETADRIRQLLQPAMDQKALRLHREGDWSLNVFADEDMAELVLRNLMSNAVKFTNTGGSITIRAEKEGDARVRITVADDGVGMPAGLVDQWNDNAATLPVRSQTGTRREKGAGLGMLLSKSFTGLIGGKLELASREGKGTTATLWLPAGE